MNVPATKFDPTQFYDAYPREMIRRPSHPVQAVFKSTLFWHRYGDRVRAEMNSIGTYADIGGCFGFGANAMAVHIAKAQGMRPVTTVIEISSGFVEIGRSLFPDIGSCQVE